MAQHINYWSCSKFADVIRGTKKLSAGTSEEWDDWTTAAQMKHNFRYWMAEEALGHVQDFVTWPIRKIYDIKYYINNRWVSRSHSLTAHPRDIEPGQWRDVGNRFLPCLFNELVDFVEVETAWMQIAWGSKEDQAKYNPPFYASGWFRWRIWRCPQAGLDHLAWASELNNEEYIQPGEEIELTNQALNAREILSLYYWWTQEYRARPDPHDASGWSAICEKMRRDNGGKFMWNAPKDPALKEESDLAHKRLQEIEKAYEDEDTEMMVRLIKIRQGLWT